MKRPLGEANAMDAESLSTPKSNILDTIKLDKALRLAKRKSKEGELEEAKSIYQDILLKFSKHKIALNELQLLAVSPAVVPQDPPAGLLQPIINLYMQGQLQQALSDATQMLERFPNSVVLYDIAGASNVGLMHFDAAIVSFKQALKIKPDYAEAYNNMGNALRDKGDPEAAIVSYEQALKIKPDYTDAHNNMGNALKDRGDPEAAIVSYEQALNIKPDYAEAYYNMGIALKAKGDLEAAIQSYKQALKIKPDYAEAYFNMGIALQDKGDQETAVVSYKQALKINPDYAEAYRTLCSLYTFTANDEYFVKMQSLFLDSSITDEKRCHLSFALSKASEDLKEVSHSFTYLEMGNQLRKKMLTYDIKQDIELFSQLKESYRGIAEAALQTTGERSELMPVFIVGMPRSGTTLAEQIISSHSEVTGAGELGYVKRFGLSMANGMIKPNAEMVMGFRQHYIEELKQKSDSKSIVIDKMPHNFQYIGLIFAAFSDAKIIHVNRNAAATCWSNYKHYFSATGLGYSYDLDDVITYFGLYQDLMQFWQGHYGDRIYNLNYENLTMNQDDETRKLIHYLGLEWENDCLSPQSNKRNVRTASQQQVRQKVYQGSSQQWRKFEPYLNGAFDQLEQD